MFASCAGRSVVCWLAVICSPLCAWVLACVLHSFACSGFALQLPVSLGLGTTLMREYSFRPLFEAALSSAFSTAASCYESSSPEPPLVPFLMLTLR